MESHKIYVPNHQPEIYFSDFNGLQWTSGCPWWLDFFVAGKEGCFAACGRTTQLKHL
jgi:hypothetical protein